MDNKTLEQFAALDFGEGRRDPQRDYNHMFPEPPQVKHVVPQTLVQAVPYEVNYGALGI